MHVFFALSAIYLVALVSPGPDFFITVRNSLRYSHRIGRWTALGIALGIVIHMTYSILGIGLLISQSVIAFNILKYLGAAYLICIGIANFLSKEEQTDLSVEKKPQENIRPIDAIKTGFFVNVLNPKATLAFVSIFSAFVTPQTPLSLQIGFAVFAVCTTFLWYFFIASVFSINKVQLAFSKARTKVDRTMGIILVSFGLRVIDV
jgi:RhtB (resistance to homoserine/threonine) family protein